MSDMYGIRCDVCGSEHRYRGFQLLVERNRAVMEFPRFHVMHKESYDLCPSCASKLKGMLEGKEHTKAKTCETCANWDRVAYCKKLGKCGVWTFEDYCSKWEERLTEMLFTNLTLGDNWQIDEWPEHVDVMHEGAGDSLKYVPERTCKMELVKSGSIYSVWRFSCCGYEHSENMTDSGATELPGTRCPKCGARVVEE